MRKKYYKLYGVAICCEKTLFVFQDKTLVLKLLIIDYLSTYFSFNEF